MCYPTLWGFETDPAPPPEAIPPVAAALDDKIAEIPNTTRLMTVYVGEYFQERAGALDAR